MTIRNLFAIAALGLLLTGCTTTITNLTPQKTPRNDKNLYPFEVAMDTTQHAIRGETVKAFVLIGFNTFPMQPTPKLKNRWEALIPVPAGENFVYYRYKFVYDYSAIPKPKESSRLSRTYQLELVK